MLSFMPRNYFKANGHIFFFADSVLESIESAYATASMLGTVSVYKPVSIPGPWDTASVIGHRPRADILQDLSLETDEEERNRLHEEITALYSRYLDVGRHEVAA